MTDAESSAPASGQGDAVSGQGDAATASNPGGLDPIDTSAVEPDGAPGRAAGDPATGDPRVDDALSRLPELDGMPLAEQVEVFTNIHARLESVLADPESRA